MTCEEIAIELNTLGITPERKAELEAMYVAQNCGEGSGNHTPAPPPPPTPPQPED